MRKGRAAKRREQQNLIRGTALFAFVLAVIGGVAYFFWTRAPALNEATLCPATGPRGYVALLIDKTDPLTFTQRQAFLALMRDVVLSVQPGELVDVFAVGEDYKDGAEPLFHMCNPGHGEKESEFTANIELLQKRFREQFQAPLLALADQLQATQSAKYSPLFEMLQLVAVNGIKRNHIEGRKRLVVVSDLLHNTPQFSMYKDMPEYDSFAMTDYAKKLGTSFGGASVELVFLMNSPRLQTRRQALFWEQYFNKRDAHVDRVRVLEG